MEPTNCKAARGKSVNWHSIELIRWDGDEVGSSCPSGETTERKWEEAKGLSARRLAESPSKRRGNGNKLESACVLKVLGRERRGSALLRESVEGPVLALWSSAHQKRFSSCWHGRLPHSSISTTTSTAMQL